MRAAVGKCEGRKGHLEVRPEVVREAKAAYAALRQKHAGSGRFQVAARNSLPLGHLNTNGRSFSTSSVRSMLSTA